jgi:hypothetical protein
VKLFADKVGNHSSATASLITKAEGMRRQLLRRQLPGIDGTGPGPPAVGGGGLIHKGIEEFVLIPSRSFKRLLTLHSEPGKRRSGLREAENGACERPDCISTAGGGLNDQLLIL